MQHGKQKISLSYLNYLTQRMLRRYILPFCTLDNLAVMGALFLCVGAGVKQSLSGVCAAGILMLCGVTWNKDGFYLFLPIFMFFYNILYPFISTPTYRLYSLLLLAKIAYEYRTIRIRVFFVPMFCVILGHILLCLWQRDSGLGFSAALDLTVVFLYTGILPRNIHRLRKFLIVLGCTGVAACMHGLLVNNFSSVTIGKSGVYSEQIKRFFVTFNDPNYAGMFVVVAIFCLLCIERDVPIALRIGGILFLVYCLTLINSMTAFACLALSMLVYLVLRFPTRAPKYILRVGAAIVVVVVIVLRVPALHELPAISGIETRVVEILRNLSEDDASKATSGRSELWAYYFDYYQDQGWYAKAFGGNVLVSTYFDKALFEPVGVASHLCYLQCLLLYGLFGTMIIFGTMFAWLIFKGITYLKVWNVEPNADVWRALLIVKIIVLFFCFSIDMFPNWWFMMIFFL